VIGGMLASTVVAIFFAPLFFWMLESLSKRKAPAAGGAVPAAAHAKREDD